MCENTLNKSMETQETKQKILGNILVYFQALGEKKAFVT